MDLIIGSHVSFKRDSQLMGSVLEAISYKSTAFMFYTGAPQNTNRSKIDSDITFSAIDKAKENGIDIKNVIVHAPYIINLANNTDLSKYNFSVNFLKEECKRCEELFVRYLVLHPGSHVGCGISIGIKNIINALNLVLPNTTTRILLETMAGKGTEVGSRLEEIKEIIDGVTEKGKIGICLDTCHLSDAGYDISNFDDILDRLDDMDLLKYVYCIHINDSKNIRESHKDRHENIGFGEIGFDNLIKIIYNEKLKNIPKILETPWIGNYPPYKDEIEMIRNKKFDGDKLKDLKEKIN